MRALPEIMQEFLAAGGVGALMWDLKAAAEAAALFQCPKSVPEDVTGPGSLLPVKWGV